MTLDDESKEYREQAYVLFFRTSTGTATLTDTGTNARNFKAPGQHLLQIGFRGEIQAAIPQKGLGGVKELLQLGDVVSESFHAGRDEVDEVREERADLGVGSQVFQRHLHRRLLLAQDGFGHRLVVGEQSVVDLLLLECRVRT